MCPAAQYFSRPVNLITTLPQRYCEQLLDSIFRIMKSAQITSAAVGLLFLVCYTHAGIVSGSKNSNDTSELLNSTAPDNISKLLKQFEPLAAASDNVDSFSTLTSTSNNKADPSSFTSNTVTSTSSNPSPGAPRFPAGVPPRTFGTPFGNPGSGAPPPLGGGFGGPIGGFGFPGLGAGGNIGFDVGVGGGLIEKAVIVVGGGILILCGVAGAAALIGKGSLLKNWDWADWGDDVATSGAGAGSVSIGRAGGSGAASASASAAASASLSKNVDEAINRRF